jgi:hypothetical protein
MSNVESKLLEGDVHETYSEAVLTRAWSKYSFEFEIDGVTCQAGYDRQLDTFYIKCPETAPEASKLGQKMFGLAEKVERMMRQSNSDLDALDTRKFLCEHLQAMIKVEHELQRAPASERRYELSNSKPIDTEGLSLEDQCLLEVIQEQSEKANNAAAANGKPDDVTYTVTADMVQAKMKEKTRQRK